MDSANKPLTLYSIGHSNHSIDRFLELLEQHSIQAVADVRSSPYSRYNPQFSKTALEQSLKEHGIAYVFLGTELGARRDDSECYSHGKVDYDEVPKTALFQRGMARLVEGASKMKVAMLCAEKDPLACHRTILIARHIKDLVDNVLHILSDGGIETQSQAEQRLLTECNLQNEDLFATREQRILEAYRQRGNHIAYEEPTLHG